jgi:hypothetical protein
LLSILLDFGNEEIVRQKKANAGAAGNLLHQAGRFLDIRREVWMIKNKGSLM